MKRTGLQYATKMVKWLVYLHGLLAAAGPVSAQVTGSDAFASRPALVGNSALGSANNTGASQESGEPDHSQSSDRNHTMWWKWTPASNGRVTLQASGAGMRPALSVYTGAELSSMRRVRAVSRPTIGSPAVASFNVAAGMEYQIALDSIGSDGLMNLSVAHVPDASAPPAVAGTDTFEYRLEMTGASALGEVCNFTHTAQASEPDHSQQSDGDDTAWWAWAAPDNGTVTMTASGAGLRPALSVYTGSDFASMQRVRTDASATAGTAVSVSFAAAKGTVYQIAMDSIGGSGNLSLAVSLVVAATTAPGIVGHNTFEYRLPLSGVKALGEICNYDHSSQSGEPDHSQDSDRDDTAWWKWTPAYNGIVTMTVTGKLMRPAISVYTGSGFAALRRVRTDSSATAGIGVTVQFAAEKGTEYQIAVDSISASGNLTLSLSQATEIPGIPGVVGDNTFEYRPTLSGAVARGVVCNFDYSSQSGEPDHSTQSDRNDTAWWSWTAPTNGRARVVVSAVGMRPVVAAYSGGSLGTLKQIASQGGSTEGIAAAIVFDVVKGATYQLATDSISASGNMDLALDVLDVPFGSSGDTDGDGQCDIGVFNPDSGFWYIRQSAEAAMLKLQWGWNACVPLMGDFDGDGMADIVAYYPDGGTWYILPSTTGKLLKKNLGWKNAVPVPGDYDGDGQMDIAVFDPKTGNWYILQSSNGVRRTQNWGWNGVVPVPNDYDGDGTCDIAVYNPVRGDWYIRQSSNEKLRKVNWGWSETAPVPGDYDGDGSCDIAVYHGESGAWYILQSLGHVIRKQIWGWSAAEPVPADYDGDGKIDIAVFGPTGDWYIRNSSTGSLRKLNWGWSATEPVLIQYQINLWLGFFD